MAGNDFFGEIGSLFKELVSIKDEVVQQVTGLGEEISEAKNDISGAVNTNAPQLPNAEPPEDTNPPQPPTR